MNNLIVTKEIIDKALNFYNINDEEYINKCYRCFKSIQASKTLTDKFNLVYKMLYLGNFDRAEIKKLWLNQTIYDIFEINCDPFITNIMLLSGYSTHIKNIQNYSLDDNQKQIHIKRVYDALTIDIYKRNYAGIRISQMLWGAYFINMKIIEVGRLQYELCFYNPITELPNEVHIKIHIPRGSKLYVEDVKDSIINSRLYVKKYFNIENPNYYCSSWLLSKELHEVVDKDSNIYNFYTLFDIVKIGGDASSDILNFVFGLNECNNYDVLPENTSLQRKLKEMLINNKPIKLGIGKLKEIVS